MLFELILVGSNVAFVAIYIRIEDHPIWMGAMFFI